MELPSFQRAESMVLHRITDNFPPSQEEARNGYLRLRRGSYVLVRLYAELDTDADYYMGCTCGDNGSQEYNVHHSRIGKILKRCVERVNGNFISPTATSRREHQQERREHRQQEHHRDRRQEDEQELQRERDQDERRRQRQQQRQRMLQELRQENAELKRAAQKPFPLAKTSSYIMLNQNTNSTDNARKWNGHIKPGQWSLKNRPRREGTGVEFNIEVNDGVPDDDEHRLATSWRTVGKGFENYLNDPVGLTLIPSRNGPTNSLMTALRDHSEDAKSKTELTVDGECVGYLYQQNNTKAFGEMLVNEGHISQSSFSGYFANSKIGQQYVFCLYNPKSLSFLFLARMSKCVYHKTDTEGNMITGLCARKLRKSIDSN